MGIMEIVDSIPPWALLGIGILIGITATIMTVLGILYINDEVNELRDDE